MYFLKTKGTNQIPDFLQIRDDDMTLLAHFKVDRLNENINNFNLKTNSELVLEQIKYLDYGVLLEIE